jgi:phosphatidylglycerophosphate synthase
MHTACRAWRKLEKQRGKLGMTWRFKVQGFVLTIAVLGGLALATGANWTDDLSWLFF